jgi:hypothetical protein
MQSLVADVCLACCLLVLQVMMKSQVCGGFWLSAAAPLPRHLQHPGEDGVLLAFSCTDETRPADTFRSKAYKVRGKQRKKVKNISKINNKKIKKIKRMFA